MSQMCLHFLWMKKILIVIVLTLSLIRMCTHKGMTRLQEENAIRQEKNEEFNFEMVENYAKDGEESAPKSVNDSENASHASEDISRSELKL